MIEPEYQALFDLLLRGAALGTAATHVGLDPREAIATIQHDPELKEAFRLTEELLCRNVEAALYQTAMAGKPAAQMMWLANRSAARWKVLDVKDQVDELNDAELIKQAAELGIELPTDF